MVERGNATEAPLDRELTLHAMIERVCATNPSVTALLQDGKKVSYQEFNHTANELAHLLQSKGVHAGSLVAIVASRSIESVVSMLAIMKAGGAYIPIDTDYPAEQIDLILEDAQPSLVLTTTSFAPKLTNVDANILVDVTAFIANTDATRVSAPVVSSVNSTGTAYIIYTSGTTGKPKGVCISHTAVVNYVTHTAMSFEATSANGSSWFTSPSFDFSITALWGTICSGATLRIISSPNGIEQVWDATTFSDFTDSFVKLTPTHVAMLAALFPEGNIKPLRRVVLGGEAVTGATVRQLTKLVPSNCIITNHYGPTEATVGCITFTVNLADLNPTYTSFLPIGAPCPNMTAYILDENMVPLSRNIAGDLYLGGVGLAQGYLNRLDLTEAKFVKNPFGEGVLYKTGDTARFDTEGRIVFLGRSDRQVKLRGYRLELSEVESTVQSVIGVEAVSAQLLAKKLVLFVVPDTLEVEYVRRKVNKLLMRSVRPDEYVMLPALPLTSHGKLDNAALTLAYENRPAVTTHGVSPDGIEDTVLTAKEEALANIWKQLLCVEHVRAGDDFFELGGNSVLAAQMVNMANAIGFLTLKLANVFDDATLRVCAADDEDGGKVSKVVVRLNKVEVTPARSPVFLVHPAGGSVGAFSQIASSLNRPVYGLIWIDSGVTDIPALAAHYVREIKLVQTVGPYTIGGFSFGSSVAWEMVKVLEANGDVVDKLILLDGGPHILHYYCARDPVTGDVEMKISDHSELSEKEELAISMENIDFTGVRRMGEHFFYGDYLVSTGTVPPPAYFALMQTATPSEELQQIVRELILTQLAAAGLSERLEEFLTAYSLHHLMLARWRPSLVIPKAKTLLVLTERTERNKFPIDDNTSIRVIQGTNHGTIMKSEMTVSEAVSYLSGEEEEGNVYVSPKETHAM